MELALRKYFILTILAVLPGWWFRVLAQEHIPLRYPWTTTGNAAGLALNPVRDTGQASIGYSLVNGDLRRPQQAASGRELRLFTESYQHLNKAFLYGSFSFSQRWEKDVRMNDMLDVYAGTPYILADSVGGDWKKQFYRVQAKASSGKLANGHLHVGAAIDYRLGTGARQNDPRPEDNSSSLSVLPGLTWSSGHSSFGLNGLYATTRESIDILIKNTNVPQRIYELTGLGQYNIPTSISTGTSRYYNGKKYGGEAQFSHSLRQWVWLSTAGFGFYREGVTAGSSTTPRILASLGEKTYRFQSSITKATDKKLQALKLDVQRISSTGTEHSWISSQGVWKETLVGDFYSSTVDRVCIGYDWLKNDALGNPLIKFSAAFSYWGQTNEYLYPYSVQSIKALEPTMRLEKSLRLATGLLTAGIRASYYACLQQQLNYQPMTTTSNLVAQLVLIPDHAYLSANKWGGGVSLLYSQPGWEDNHSRWFIKGAGDVYSATGGQRLFLSFGVGVFY